MTRWKNNKTGLFYSLLAQATDRTNSRDGTHVIVYSPNVRSTSRFRFVPDVAGKEPDGGGAANWLF